MLKSMMNKYNKEMISYKLLKVFQKISVINGKTRHYGTDQLLYEAEMRIIKAIRENEGIHVTALADMLGITKGAVSHSLIQLQKKGVILKQPDSTNQSRLLLKLTDKGETAYQNHEKLHEGFDFAIEALLKNESSEFKSSLDQFLVKLDGTIADFDAHTADFD
jgi:DNA-binding MarR family transcriptional regulator